MRKILFLMLAALAIAGCNGSDEEDSLVTPEPAPVKEHIVSFGFYGEITDITESPLSRAATDDLYGIQVYSTLANGAEYKPYAYGLFDDKTKMNIKLLEGYKYRFISTMIVDGKNKLYHSPGFLLPINVEGGRSTLNNNFTYSTSSGMYMMDSGAATMSDGSSYNIPKLDRYFGETTEYIPSENKSISINMRRVSFGIKVILENFNEGKSMIAMKGAPAISIQYPEIEINELFTFGGRYSTGIWTEDDYTETIPLSVSWEKVDGSVVPLVSQDITFKRNKLTTITVKVKDNSVDNMVDITQDNTVMGQGDNITIDTSSSSNTEVNPK